MNDFDEYIRQGEPNKIEKSKIWQTAIGLQQVDGLKPSAYLIETAKQNIEGDITFDEVNKRIDAYYRTDTKHHASTDNRTEEADKVSAHIAEVLSEKTFSFTPAEYLNIHRRLFYGVYKFAGKIRDYNITKSEWVLDGETVLYAAAPLIRETLEYDFREEKKIKYKGLTKQEQVEHIAKFVSGLWQIHAFGEGNTRTTAVFTIKYLRNFGFKVENDMFAQNSWYFRNALVRANYNDHTNNIYATTKYLNRFFNNLLFGENDVLKNRYLHIKFVEPEKLGVNDTLNVGEMSEKCRRNVGEMSERQNKILEIIATNKTISALQLSELLNTTDRTIEREMKKMREMNIIERIGGDRGGHWEIKK
ncbi:MAG: Fic family protein [Bacteroidales bacterium]|jgi:fido (protein-threonine AMPylation protein)|nr:Fic family protein [Bacteroidales bacterium]